MNFSITKNYRPEIDGLRAIAVILILLFHAGYEWTSGGFIGVDVFFVISGYLITRNIAFQINNETFLFSKFYINRIRRLMPALFFTLFMTLVLGFYIFSPIDLERLGTSLISALFSLSNFFFWSEADYFNPTSDIKPLLHTWSLAVEEQFYLIWPALLVGLYKLKNKSMLVLFFLTSIVFSLYISLIYIENQPEAVFFLLPFRFFEFSIGALCVFINRKLPQKYFTNDLVFITGLIMIIAPALAYTKETVFPGLFALVPCLGTAAIIYVGKASNFIPILSNKFLVKIGLISYSTYLIHWPIFVFYKYWMFEEIGHMETLFLLLTSFIAGYLMWKFIENPFRYKKQRGSKQEGSSRLFLLSMLLIVTSLFYVSNYVRKHEGIPSRMPAEFLLSQEQIFANRTRFRSDFSTDFFDFLKGDVNSKNVVIIGNSHAVDLMYVLRENGSTLNFTLLSTSSRCFNFGTPVKSKFANYCKVKLDFILKTKHYEGIDSVYLHDNWPRFNGEDLEQRLAQIREVTDAPIYVFGPKMTYEKPVTQIVASHMRMASINQYSIKFRVSHREKTNRSVKSLIENINTENVFFVDVLKSQCGEKFKKCQIVSDKNQKFLYFDAGHLTLQGARELGENLKTNYPDLF